VSQRPKKLRFLTKIPAVFKGCPVAPTAATYYSNPMTQSPVPTLPPELDRWPYHLMRRTSWPLRVRKKIGRIMGDPPKGIDFTIPLFGNYYHGTTGYFQDDKIVQYGSHESATLRLSRAILQEQKKRGLKTSFVDIGTNTGQHLIAVLDVADVAYGFEPWDKVRLRAERSLIMNDAEHVKIFPVGLGDQDADMDYAVPTNNNIGTGSFSSDTDQKGLVIRLQVKRGDKFLNEQNIHPTLIKIDTEGFETKVLRGLSGMLHADHPVIIFEYSSMTRKALPRARDILALLGDSYALFGICRSRELPKLDIFTPDHKWENIVALPNVGLARIISEQILKDFK
jgi:FkbM family methyltransferase